MTESVPVTPHQLAAIRRGLWSTPHGPDWSLAMRELDLIEGKAQAAMPPELAKAWMAVVTAPLALKAAEATIATLRARARAAEIAL